MNLQKLRPQQKIVNVNNNVGNSFIKDMQGTTKMIFDTLPLDGTRKLVFFENTNSRNFPFTNVTSDQLQAAETMSIDRISLSLCRFDNAGVLLSIIPFDINQIPTPFIPLSLGTLEIMVAQDNVMLPIAIQHFSPQFNKTANDNEQSVFEMNTTLIIIPQQNIRFTVSVPAYQVNPEQDWRLRLIVEGVGSQFNGKTNF